MRHLCRGRKLGRTAAGRKALLKGLAKALVLNERIETTEAKAKELRPFIERLVTRGKSDTLHARRLIIQRLGDPLLAEKVLHELGPRYKERNGGYTRIIKTRMRSGDAAHMAVIEFV